MSQASTSHYTDEDLIDLYKGCKSPKKQIGILCDLSRRKRADVIKVLLAAGLDVPNGTKTSRAYGWTQEELVTLQELRQQGLSTIAIAERLGRSRHAINYKSSQLSI